MNFKEFWYSNFYEGMEKEEGQGICDSVKECEENGISYVLNEMIQETNEDVVVACLERCGNICLRPEIVKVAKEALQITADLDTVIKRLNREGIGGGKMYREGDTIYASYDTCYCPFIKNEKEVPPIYCNCSRGWFGELFTQLLGKPVKVELERSIARGGKTCDFIIHI